MLRCMGLSSDNSFDTLSCNVNVLELIDDIDFNIFDKFKGI